MVVTASKISKAAAVKEYIKRRKLRERCQNDLLEFIKYTHPCWEEADHHRLLCNWLMKLAACEIRNLAIFAPPRSGKSEIVSRRFPAWLMGKNPGFEMICVQSTAKLAEHMGANVRDIIKSEFYQDIFPDTILDPNAKAAGRWLLNYKENPLVGTYYASGVGGTIIGRGAQLLNIDDPLDSQGAMSPRQRDVAANFYFGDAIQRLMHPKLQLFTTTRRHEDDLAGRILPPESTWEPTDDPRVFIARGKVRDKREVEPWYVIKLEAIINEGTKHERALWPGKDNKRFPLDYLKEIRQSIFAGGDSREWYAQYQQQVVPEEGVFCKKAWFADRYDNVPDDLWIYATSDLAVTETTIRKNPDYTEHCVYGLSGLQQEYDINGQVRITADSVYVLDWWAGQTGPEVWIEELIKLFKRWGPAVWFGTKGQIRNAIEGYLAKELRRERCWVRLEWLSDHRDKILKGMPLQGMAAQRRIKFPKTTWAERVIQQICSVPNSAKDDAYDTAANMIRSMGELPDAFSGAPVRSVKKPKDTYVEWPIKTRKCSWKSV